MINFLHKIIHLPATIEKTDKVRKITFDYNKKDKSIMERLMGAIEKINKLKVIGPQGKQMVFCLKK
jgi:hypothetical protein